MIDLLVQFWNFAYGLSANTLNVGIDFLDSVGLRGPGDWVESQSAAGDPGVTGRHWRLEFPGF